MFSSIKGRAEVYTMSWGEKDASSLVILRIVIKWLFGIFCFWQCYDATGDLSLKFAWSISIQLSEPNDYHWRNKIHKLLLTYTNGFLGVFVMSISSDMFLYNKETKKVIFDSYFPVLPGEVLVFKFLFCGGILFKNTIKINY